MARFSWLLAAGAVLWCAVVAAYPIATRPPVDYGAAIVGVGFYGPAPLGPVVRLSRGPALPAVLAVAQTTL